MILHFDIDPSPFLGRISNFESIWHGCGFQCLIRLFYKFLHVINRNIVLLDRSRMSLSYYNCTRVVLGWKSCLAPSKHPNIDVQPLNPQLATKLFDYWNVRLSIKLHCAPVSLQYIQHHHRAMRLSYLKLGVPLNSIQTMSVVMFKSLKIKLYSVN